MKCNCVIKSISVPELYVLDATLDSRTVRKTNLHVDFYSRSYVCSLIPVPVCVVPDLIILITLPSLICSFIHPRSQSIIQAYKV